VTRTSEDQDAIQRPDITKDPETVSDIKKPTAWPIEENKDGAVVLKCYGWALKWVALKCGRVCALISRAM
jgi:hypothetical protein